MIYITKYRLVDRGGISFVCAEETLRCPVCGGELYQIGRRWRGYIDAGEEKRGVQIRRLLCAECGNIHHELPDLLIPYKRHCADTAANIAAGETDAVPCDPSCTHKIKQWWSLMLPYFAGVLAAITGVKFAEKPTHREIVRAVVNGNYRTFPGRLRN